jgi:tight adherence protein B
MSVAPLLAFGAGAAGVLAAWEALAAVERSPLAGALERALEPVIRAGREGRAPTAPERRRLAVLAAGCLASAGWLVAGPLAGLAAALAAPVAVVAVLRSRRRRYAEALRRGAAGTARALADALAAGHSVRGAIAATAPALPGAAGHELRTTARALALGAPTDAELERLRRRADGPAWDTIIAAILLQRHAGGDLAGLLRGLAVSLEAAERIERDARAATAQARFTAWLVLGLPAGAAVLAELGDPGFVAALLGNPISAWLTGLALVLQLLAVICVRRLARPEAMT